MVQQTYIQLIILLIKTNKDYFFNFVCFREKIRHRVNSNLRCFILRKPVNAGTDIGKRNGFAGVINC